MKSKPETPDDIPDYAGAVRLDGQGFVVLGAGQGIGAQASHALSQVGARLLCVDNDQGRAEEIAKATGGEGIVANATDRGDMTRVFERADALFGDSFSGVVDVIGVASSAKIASITDEAWAQQQDIVVRHALLALQLGAPMLAKAGGGAMTFVGSISGLVAIGDAAAYSSAKAGLHHLVRMAAQEFGRQGVRINTVAPGPVRTPRLNARLPEETWARTGRSIWLGRPANPSDIARAILFLSSDLGRYMNGNTLTLDGGTSNGTPLDMG